MQAQSQDLELAHQQPYSRGMPIDLTQGCCNHGCVGMRILHAAGHCCLRGSTKVALHHLVQKRQHGLQAADQGK